MTTSFNNKYCIIIPVYNHQHKLKILIAALSEYNYPIIIVDDGSNIACKKLLENLTLTNINIQLLELTTNQGKGAAVMHGFNEAYKREFTHVIQIDADFQHNVNDISLFVKLSDQQPKALICGIPKYDETVPKGRLYSRYITHVWVWIHTLSFEIKDSMCGYRLYPLEPTINLINNVNISKRMSFDTDIIVRLKWRGVKIINQLTKVVYHDDVPSNFRMFKDNVAISWTHTKLFFGMIIRFPTLMARKLNAK